MKSFEKLYGKALKKALKFINPFKKVVIKTECQVHKFITIHSIKILKKYGYESEYKLFTYHIKYLNEGVVWADQDFKSINHFYNPTKKRGLFGNDNSLMLTQEYYDKAKKYWNDNKKQKAMFYLGACVHIIQDLTIPQHVNIRLLDNHRQYENFVKLTYSIVREYKSKHKPIVFSSVEEYVEYNSNTALKIYKKTRHIKDNKKRFYKVTLNSLPLAQRSTAGLLLTFLKDVKYDESINRKA